MAKKAKPKAAAEEGGEKKSKKKLIILVVAAGGLYKFVLAPKPADPAAEAAAAGGEIAIPEGEIYSLEEMVLNLAIGEDGIQHYVRVEVGLVTKEGVNVEHFELEAPIAKGVIVEFFAETTIEDLREPHGIEDLKHDLSEEVAHAYHEGQVVRIIFTGLTYQ